MARPYAPRTFLRLTDKTLVQRYFAERRPDNPIDQSAWDDSSWVGCAFDAWQEFPDEERAAVDADFQRINDLTGEAGVRAISEEVAARGVELSEEFEGLDGAHERAMLLFIEDPAVFEIVERFAEAYERSPSKWKRRKNIPHVVPRNAPNDIEHFSFAVTEYLRQTEGRGSICHVDHYVRAGKHFFFTYPEDYGSVHLEYVEGVLARRVTRPAFEIDFVYGPDEQTLDVFCTGSRKRVSDLQEIFARTILGVDLGPSASADRVLDLNKLKSRRFRWAYGATGIRDVTVKRLAVIGIGGMSVRHTIDADTKVKRDVIYDELERTFLTAGQDCAGWKVLFRRKASTGFCVRSWINKAAPHACCFLRKLRISPIGGLGGDGGESNSPSRQ